jgi:hypothetical protein
MYVQCSHFFSFNCSHVRFVTQVVRVTLTFVSLQSWRQRHRLSARRLIRRSARDSPRAPSTQCRSPLRCRLRSALCPPLSRCPRGARCWRSSASVHFSKTPPAAVRSCACRRFRARRSGSRRARSRCCRTSRRGIWSRASGRSISWRAPTRRISGKRCRPILAPRTTRSLAIALLAPRGAAASRTIALQFARASDGAVTTVDVVGGRHGTPTLHAPAGVVASTRSPIASRRCWPTRRGGGGDLCVLSAEGCGKSVMCAWFAQALGYGADEVVHVDLFKEVSTRDLFMRRDTSDSGDTVWQMQPLVQAVLHGRLALLDGAHRPPPGVLAALTELLLDRQLALDDGTRILCAHAYDAMQFREALTDEQMLARGWRRAHEAFRVVLCGNTASSHAEERAAAHSWLTADLIAGLRCHVLPELTATLLRLVVRGACGAALPEVVVEDLACVVELQRRLVRPAPLVPPAMGVEEERRLSHAPQSAPPQFTAASLPLLSLRAALRVARKAAMFGVHSVFDAVGSSAAVRLAGAGERAAARLRAAARRRDHSPRARGAHRRHAVAGSAERRARRAAAARGRRRLDSPRRRRGADRARRCRRGAHSTHVCLSRCSRSWRFCAR